ncbi:MAG TPA: FKBP-type peptidyl-prolyl cis-trans isomerase [Sphingobacteriaceae bacterium]
MTKRLLVLLFSSGTLYASAQTGNPAQTQTLLKTKSDSASYALGLSVAEDLKSRGVKNLNYSLLAKAMEDTFNNKPALLNGDQRQKAIYAFLEAANKERQAAALAEGTRFLEENKKKSGITTLPSGLQYQIIKAGTGAKPKASDDVTVHYKGTLLNGKQFDSSYDRNEPLEIKLSQVIPGWTEGVQLMPVGSKYRFFIPYQLGYGENGAGQDIPPYSVLIFEIELIKIGK